MAKQQESTTNKREFSIVSVKHLALKSGIPYSRLYNILVLKRYDSLSENEKTVLSNTLFAEIKAAFKTFGFKLSPPSRLGN